MSKGFVIWFTGLSGSGKSTLTSMVAAELRRRGVHVETLDGDDIRMHLSKGLGFSREDRDENVRRIGFVAKLVSRSGACAIAAAISPYASVRLEVRKTIENFVEVYTECPIDVLADRDPKGLYKKALAGEIQNFTGVNDPYEAPTTPEVHLHTSRESPEASLERILRRLEEDGLIPAWGKALSGAVDPRGSAPPPPHGMDLIERVAGADNRAGLRESSNGLPVVDLDSDAHFHLIAIATGAYSPLRGFMTSKDYLRVVREMRLESGLPWGLPITLEAPADRVQELGRASSVALRAPDGHRVAILDVQDLYPVDEEAGGARHWYLGGDVRCFDPTAPTAVEPWRTPREVRDEMLGSGQRDVVAIVTADPPLHGDEYLARAALEFSDGLLVQPLALNSAAIPVSVRARCYSALLERYFPPHQCHVAPFAWVDGASRKRTLIHQAIVAKNFGARRLLVLGATLADGDRRLAAFRSFSPEELGIEILPAGLPVTSRSLGTATRHTADPDAVLVDATAVLESIRNGTETSAARPEVVAILRDHFARLTTIR